MHDRAFPVQAGPQSHCEFHSMEDLVEHRPVLRERRYKTWPKFSFGASFLLKSFFILRLRAPIQFLREPVVRSARLPPAPLSGFHKNFFQESRHRFLFKRPFSKSTSLQGGLWPCWPRPNPIIAKHKGPQNSAGGRQVGPSQGLLRASPGFSSGHPKEFRAKGAFFCLQSWHFHCDYATKEGSKNEVSELRFSTPSEGKIRCSRDPAFSFEKPVDGSAGKQYICFPRIA